jgi:hypothetical protein
MFHLALLYHVEAQNKNSCIIDCMQKTLFNISLCIFAFTLEFLFGGISVRNAYAIEDPLSHPNNKVGVHILFPSEVIEAAKLVNTNGGSYGYIIIPLQAGDRDIEKWQKFLDDCRAHHIIPIIRLATEGDYFNTAAWRKPTDSDILDFANFLSSLNFPTKNRYIVVFNEVNRGDEWGGIANPAEYAEILQYTSTVFKAINDDFFIISGGMDNVHGNSSTGYNQYSFMRAMENAVPGVFNSIDGISSHSYPNPAFSQPASRRGPTTIESFRHEKALIESFTEKTLPIFITETGWPINAVSESRAAQYYNEAFTTVWSDPSVVAVTPFILTAGTPPFNAFSLIDEGGSPRLTYKAIQELPKVKGEPTIQTEVLGEKTLKATQTQVEKLPVKDFKKIKSQTLTFSVPEEVRVIGKWFLKL